jgi:uncharacterized protein
MKSKGFSFDSSYLNTYYRAPMSVGTLPQYIDVQKWADREAVIDQAFPLSSFLRLCQGALDDSGKVSVSVGVHRDAQGLFVMEGRMSSSMALCCQRCLEAVATDIEVELKLWLLREESKADLLPEDADYLVLDEEGKIALADALEDELILALPLVPLHEDCEMYQAGIAENDEVEDPKRENPFQVLASLKGSVSKD